MSTSHHDRTLLAVPRDQSLEVRILPLGKVLIPVPEIIVDAKGRCVRGRRRRRGRGVRIGQSVRAARVERRRRARGVGPRGAPAAPHRHLPVRGIDLGPGLEDLERFASIRRWDRPLAVGSFSIMCANSKGQGLDRRTLCIDLTL